MSEIDKSYMYIDINAKPILGANYCVQCIKDQEKLEYAVVVYRGQSMCLIHFNDKIAEEK